MISVKSTARTAINTQTVFGLVSIATPVISYMHYSPLLCSPALSREGRVGARNN